MKITFRSMPVKAMLLLFSFLLTAAISNAQCILSKGDIVFTGYDLIDDQVSGTNAGDGSNDRFSFVILRDITAGTEIFFTDLGWTSLGQFQSTDRARTDGVIKWVSAVALNAGTEITINTKFSPTASVGTVTGVLQNYETKVDYPGLSPEYMSLAEISGDQIFAFTGNYLSSPLLLAAMSVNTPWATSLEYFETSSGRSMLPAILSTGAQNLAISRSDANDPEMGNAYTARLRNLGAVSGAAAAIVSTVNNSANWEMSPSATPYVEFASLTNGNIFTLSPPTITTQPVNAIDVCPAGQTFFQVTADATACGYQWQTFNTASSLWEDLPNTGIYGTTATTSRLSISNVTGLNGKKYRVRVYGAKPVLSSEVSVIFLPALSITTASLPEAAKFVTYNQQLSQTGGKAAYAYSLNTGSNLPTGMTLSATGVLGGAPTVHGTYNFTIKVTDGCGTTATQTFTLNITPEPLITSVSVPANGFYKAGDNLDFTVNYDAPVNVTSFPALGLTIGSSAASAAFIGGTGSSSLNFRYTVQSGDLDQNGITITGIILNGATIRSLGGTNADNSLVGAGSTGAVNVDGVFPVVSSVTSSLANGTYNAGTIIPITVTFSENVVVTGTPQLSLETGSTDRTANYVSGSGSNTIAFSYTVQSGDISPDLDYVSTGALVVSGEGIADAAGNNAVLTLASPGAAGSLGAAKGLVIDTQSPVISMAASVNANGSYNEGAGIGIRITLNEAVTVTGTPRLVLNSGGSASYAFGSGNSVLAFTYTVAAGESSADLDYSDINSLSLAGGTIRDAAGNSANLMLPVPGSANSIGGSKDIVIDAVAPSVLSTGIPSNGIYGIGQNLDIIINYSEPVTMNTTGGIPYVGITLNTGGTVRAGYISGSGTSALTFRYTVASGNMDTDGISLAGSITLNGGTFGDAAGNNASISGISAVTTNIRVDGLVPTASLVVADAALAAGETSLVTITFSEAISGFTLADMTVANGTIADLATADGGITWTAMLTPTSGITDATNLITLANTGVSDLAGNAGTGTTNSNNYTIDTARPGASIVMSDVNLTAGETALVTITFSEAVSGFTLADLTVASGTLSNPASADGGITWTATFTPSAGTSHASNVITLDNSGVADAAGNAGTGTTDSNNYAIDNVRPTASIAISDTDLAAGETALVTITFSEAVSGFTLADLTVANGTLSGLASADGGITWTATFTPTAGITDASNLITLDNTGVADLSGNAGTGTTDSNNYSIDTAGPTATIVMADAALTAGETSLVTITFSEAVTGFSNTDLSIGNGTLTAVSSGDGGITWTATFTPTADIADATNLIVLANSGVSDAAGNAGSGTSISGNYAINTVRPTAAIVVADAALAAGETSLVTITFSEAVAGFSNADLTIANAVLSTVSSVDGGVTWAATLTPSAGITVAGNLISLDNIGVINAAGNTGTGTTNSNSYSIDTTRPTASIMVADALLSAGETSLVTITFSEAVTGFTLADLTIANGIVTGLASVDGGITWTATLTPSAGITSVSNLITLNNSGVTDLAGNAGIGTTASNNYSIDTQGPGASIVVADSDLSAGETSFVTITFSEAVTGFTNADMSAANGTLTGLNSTDGGITWTATLTPTAGITDASNLIILANTGVSDAAGNSGNGTTASNNYAIDTNLPEISSATIASNNSDPEWAKAGDVITINLTASEFIQSPVVTIAGQATAVSGSGNTYMATYTMRPSDTEGLISFNIIYADLAGNNGAAASSASDGSSVVFDRTAPLVPVDLAATAGNTSVVITWSANTEPDLKAYNVFAGTLSNPASLIQSLASGSSSFTHNGLINGTTYHYRITATDKAGNESSFTAEVNAVPVAGQTIAFPALPSKIYGDASFTLGPLTSSAGLPVTYTAGDASLVSISGNTASILKAGTTTITARQAGNAAFEAAPDVIQTLTVNRQNLIISNSERSKVYGQILADADFSGSISGLQNSDNITVLRSSTGSAATATTGSTYPITATIADPDNKLANYTVSNTDGTLTVTPKALTITAADRTKTYGESVTFVGTEFISAGLINGDAVTSITLNSTGAAASANVAGSPYTIVPSAAAGNGMDNYAISYSNGTLEVGTKDLTIIAESKTRFAGTANPDFTLTYTGFVNGEDESIFSTRPAAASTATAASAIGEYPITISPVTAANYNMIYQNGILKVVPGAPKAVSFTASTLYENSPAGTIAGMLSSGSDDPNAIFSYSLVAGAGDTDNSLFSISGQELRTLAGLNYETKTVYTVRVSSATQHGFSLDKVITVSLSDVNEAPSIAQIADQVICYTNASQELSLGGINAGPEGSSQTVTLSVNSSNPALFNELKVSKDGLLSYRLKEGVSGTASLTVTAQDNGGTANGGVDSFSRTFTVTVNALPQITVISDKGNSISKGETIRLTATGGRTYSWNNPGGVISGQQSATMTVRPAATATYRVTVTTAEGCVSEQQITVEVKEDFKLVKGTNILSPNGDGVNDRFIIRNIDMYPNNTVKIFDRAGRLLYSKTSYANEWDGTFQGSPLTEDTYFYVVDFGPGKMTLKGFITVVRAE